MTPDHPSAEERADKGEVSMSERGFACIALKHPKFDGNVGGVLRAAYIYGASLVVISGNRFKKEPTDTMAGYRHVPVVRVADVFEALPYDCVPVAVDLIEDAKPLPDYQHPQRAFYVFGAEDATLGRLTLDRCRDRVFIPTVRCMNLAATVNVVLYDRLAKKKP